MTSPASLRSLALALVVVGATSLGPAACRPAGPPPSAPSPLAQQGVPDFARPTLAGARIDTKELRGQVVVIKFFAKYCEPCKHTLPAAEKLHRKHPNVAFVGVSEDEYASDAQALVDGFGLSFPVVHDQGNVLAGRFRVSEMPVTFVVDAQGVVQWVGGPGQGEDDLAAAIAAFGG
ncbi:TlpA family protein disulfide reductase [Paraliomyxa miuraensis]|nr:TlpA family protein disulfide reductase [Paraliomyxa miuraensis]